MLAATFLSSGQTAVAQSVVIRQFSPHANGHSAFILTPVVGQPQRGGGILHNDLAADFDAIKPAAAEPSIRNADTRRFAPPLASDCRGAPYRPSPRLSAVAERRRATWYFAMASAACEAGLPITLLDALVIAESQYNPAALSPKGAAGLAQLMPGSARSQGVDNVWDPNANLHGGAHLLRALLDEFGRFDLALAAYNAGPRRVRLTHQVPHIPETLHYVSGILTTMHNQLVSAADTMP